MSDYGTGNSVVECWPAASRVAADVSSRSPKEVNQRAYNFVFEVYKGASHPAQSVRSGLVGSMYVVRESGAHTVYTIIERMIVWVRSWSFCPLLPQDSELSKASASNHLASVPNRIMQFTCSGLRTACHSDSLFFTG